MRIKLALLLVATSIFLSACGNQDEKTRARIAEVEKTGRQVTQAVEDYARKRKRFPAHIEEAYVRPTAMKDIKLLSVEQKSGQVRVQLAFAPVEGKSLVFVPMRNKDKSLTWRCTSRDIDARYLPDSCK